MALDLKGRLFAGPRTLKSLFQAVIANSSRKIGSIRFIQAKLNLQVRQDFSKQELNLEKRSMLNSCYLLKHFSQVVEKPFRAPQQNVGGC